MGKVVASMSISLDGFIEDRDARVGELFTWYSDGDRTVEMPGDSKQFVTHLRYDVRRDV